VLAVKRPHPGVVEAPCFDARIPSASSKQPGASSSAATIAADAPAKNLRREDGAATPASRIAAT